MSNSGRDQQPTILLRDEALAVADALGGRLPTEAEWETAYRAGRHTLFPWGDNLPLEAELTRWLAWGPDARRNRWGFGGLFHGEWCGDEWRRIDGPPEGRHSTRSQDMRPVSSR